MKRSIVLVAVLATLAGGCASNKRVETLEARVRVLEAELAEAHRREELRTAGLESRVAARVDGASAGMADKVAELDETLARLEALAAELKANQQRPVRPSRPTHDPAVTYAVPIDDSPFVGPRHAKVTIVEAYEFACPFCDKVRPTLDQLRKDYGKDLKIVYRSFIVHPQVATTPALAACAAHKQGAWKAMHDALWIDAFMARKFDEANMIAIASKVGLDGPRFERDLRGPACAAELVRDQTSLQRVGVGATPNFFINGRFLAGAQPLAAFKAVIDEELAKADVAIKGGIKLKDYYGHLLKTGRPELTPPTP